MSKLAKALTAAAGNAGAGALYVEDVFSTYLYTGNGSTQTITNGIDLDGEGGLVWMKSRSASYSNALFDTQRGGASVLASDRAGAANEFGSITGITFNSNGFYLPDNASYGWTNTNAATYASWTFRKAEKFFDVVTWTGNGVQGRAISHNLNSNVGCVIVKRTDASSGVGWAVWHNSSDNLALNLTSAQNQAFNNDILDVTSTTFTVSAYSDLNASGGTYVAYLFASDAGGFGDDGDESIIKCGSYTGTGSAGNEVNLGFEPQWILIKGATSGAAYDWYLVDNMRGITTGGNDPLLWPNKSDAEDTASNIVSVTATGFKLEGTGFGFNRSGETYIYIAIRRPMKTPESGTEVFNDTFQYGEDGKTAGYLGSPADLDIRIDKTGGGSLVRDRLRGDLYLRTQATDAEAGSQSATWDNMTGYFYYSAGTSANTNIIHYVFKRATGFFDVVAYTGTGVARTVNHNLGVVPELMILKVRNRAGSSWVGYHKDLGNEGGFSLTNFAAFSGVTSAWNSTTPTSSVFTVGTGSNYNGNTDNLIAYLFATLAGVSKVGSYTGTGSNVDVDCGFSAGARFILIKRTDSSGDWYVYDSVRGIVAGNDPYLLLNSTASEVTSTDYIDPLNAGFTVTSSAPAALNASGGTYIFLAIA